MNPSHAATLDSPLTAISPEGFIQGSVVAELYSLSKPYEDSRLHAEGQAVLPALIAHVADYRRTGVDRVNDVELGARVQAALDFARCVLSEIPDVEAVVFYGSALRGKPAAQDFDFRLVTTPMPTSTIDFENPVMNAVQNRVHQAFQASSSIPKNIRGLPVEIHINSAFSDLTGMELEYVQRGPYLAIMRGADSTSLSAFINTSGVAYRAERAP